MAPPPKQEQAVGLVAWLIVSFIAAAIGGVSFACVLNYSVWQLNPQFLGS